MYFKGMITLPDSVDVTDPCYDRDVWCRMKVCDLIPGKYNCFYDISDEEECGRRVSEILIMKSDQDTIKRFVKDTLPWEEIGEIGVDAGLAGFFDDKPDFSDPEWQEFCDSMDDFKEMAWMRKFDGKDGFYALSGYGDGCYPVSVLKDTDGKVYAVMIRFI